MEKSFNPLEYFPSRIGLRIPIQGTDEGYGATGVSRTKRPRVVQVIVPNSTDAHGRTVRLHESAHCKLKNKFGYLETPFGELTANAIADGYIHTHTLKDLLPSVRRDELAVAAHDLRKLPSDPARWNGSAYLIALRSLCIHLRHKDNQTLRNIALKKIPSELGRILMKIQRHIREKRITEAARIFHQLVTPPGRSKDRFCPKGKLKSKVAKSVQNVQPPMFIETLPMIASRDVNTEPEKLFCPTASHLHFGRKIDYVFLSKRR